MMWLDEALIFLRNIHPDVTFNSRIQCSCDSLIDSTTTSITANKGDTVESFITVLEDSYSDYYKQKTVFILKKKSTRISKRKSIVAVLLSSLYSTSPVCPD